MNTIKDIWFDANRIYVKTDDEKTFSRRLVTMFVGNHWMRIFIYPAFLKQWNRIMKMR